MAQSNLKMFQIFGQYLLHTLKPVNHFGILSLHKVGSIPNSVLFKDDSDPHWELAIL